MSVIPLTVFCSLGLAFLFVAFFLREQRRRLFGSAERDSLLPLATEEPRLAGTGTRTTDPTPELERDLRTCSEPVQRPGSTPRNNSDRGAPDGDAHPGRPPGHPVR